MRLRATMTIAALIGVAACSSSPDVLVTESGGTDEMEAVTPTVVTPAPAPSTVPAAGARALDDLVLVDVDLPDWTLVRPMTVADEETWQADDCGAMNIAWDATGGPGVRSRGSLDDARFRQTAVRFDSVAEASAVMDAVDRVWIDCNPVVTSTDDFWVEPFELPASALRTAGLLLGSEQLSPWVLGFWQVDDVIVSIEIEGDDLWTHVDPLLAAAAGRVAGRPVTPTPSTPPSTAPAAPTSTTVPLPVEPPVDMTVPPGSASSTTSVPPVVTSSTTVAPDLFPPADADWTDHPLAHLAPHPDELGAGWTYSSGTRNEAEPADPADAIPGCDAVVPPTLDGFEVSYQLDASPTEWEAEIIVGQGSPDNAQLLVDAVRDLAGCDLGTAGFGEEYSLSDASVRGADDSAAVRATVGDTTSTYHLSIVVARVGGVQVGVFLASTDDLTAEELETTTIDVAASMLADL